MESQETEFLRLVEEFEQLKEKMKALKPKMHELLEQIGPNSYFQGNGLVYKVVRPEGTFISFDKIGYVRTKKPTEKRGSLSAKEAKENGFTV